MRPIRAKLGTIRRRSAAPRKTAPGIQSTV
jgi:hypothetical protein